MESLNMMDVLVPLIGEREHATRKGYHKFSIRRKKREMYMGYEAGRER